MSDHMIQELCVGILVGTVVAAFIAFAIKGLIELGYRWALRQND